MSDDADDRERREAQALADALAGDAGDAEAPDDALEAAALLRYSAREGELDAGRSEALLAQLLPAVDKVPVRKVTRLRAFAWAGGALAAAAVILLFVLRASDSAPSHAPGHAPPVAASRLPRPPASLLAAQARFVRDGAARDPAPFALEMTRYREQVLRALEREYPARVGQLDLRGRR